MRTLLLTLAILAPACRHDDDGKPPAYDLPYVLTEDGYWVAYITGFPFGNSGLDPKDVYLTHDRRVRESIASLVATYAGPTEEDWIWLAKGVLWTVFDDVKFDAYVYTFAEHQDTFWAQGHYFEADGDHYIRLALWREFDGVWMQNPSLNAMAHEMMHAMWPNENIDGGWLPPLR